jgi:hypothetical protein
LVDIDDDIIDLYYHALQKNPNEEWANHWFMAIVRKGDFKQVQQVNATHQAAVKINRDFKSNKYYFWMVVSIYVQSQDIHSPNRTILLTLAERMIQKGIQEGKLDTFEMLQLYLMVLRDQNKFDEALAVLEGPVASVCKVDIDLKRFLVEFSESKQDWGRSEKYAKEILAVNPDDWQALEALLQSYKVNGKNPSEFLEFNKSLQDRIIQEKALKRGAFLSEYYYLADSQSNDQLVDCFVQYVKRFGATLSCYDDMYPKLQSLPVEHVPVMLDQLQTLLVKSLSKIESKVQQTRLNITVLKLKRYLQSFARIEMDRKEEIKFLVDMYNESTELSIAN